MPWESRTVEDQRTEFAQAAMSCRNFSALCREYGITRRTGLKWKARYEAQETMSDRSRRPKHSPTRTPEDVEQQIVALRSDNPGWGAKTLRKKLENDGVHGLPSVKTVNNILHRYGCIRGVPEASGVHAVREGCVQRHVADGFQGRVPDGGWKLLLSAHHSGRPRPLFARNCATIRHEKCGNSRVSRGFPAIRTAKVDSF